MFQSIQRISQNDYRPERKNPDSDFDLHSIRMPDDRKVSSTPDMPPLVKSGFAGIGGSDYNIAEREPLDPERLNSEIQGLFDGALNAAITAGERWSTIDSVDVEGYDINVRVSYNGRSGIFITLPDEPERIMRIDLSADATPNKIASIDDHELFLPQIASRLGLDMQAQGYTFSPDSLERWASDLHITAVQNQRIADMRSDINRLTQPNSIYIDEPGAFVRQNMFQVADLDQPLSTHGLDTCSALIVIDQQNGKHYLAHLDALSDPQRIVESLRDLDISSAEIFLAPGSGDDTLSFRNGVNALDQLGVTESIQILQLGGMFPGVISHDGEVFALPPGDNLADWERGDDTRF